MDYEGQGVTQDFKTAFNWFKQSAKQEFACGQNNLGVMYMQGQGVAQDFQVALKWFELAAEQGHAKAQNSLGLMYANGQGLIQDLTRAYMWWDIAESKGNANAAVGRTDVEKVMTTAQIAVAQKLVREWLANNNKGTPRHNNPAANQYDLGLKYALGKCVAKDLTRAYMWWDIAASLGNKDAKRKRGIIEEQMIPADVLKAQELARECVAKDYKDC
jgi:TPR repeat protein